MHILLNMEKQISGKDVPALLHSAFFGFELAHGKLTGNSSRAIMQGIIKYLPLILNKEGQHIFDHDSTLEENVKSFRDYLSNPELFEKVIFEKTGDNSYNFELRGCAFAKSGVHDILAPEKCTCPFAIIASTIIYELSNKDITTSYSEINNMDSKTNIQIFSLNK